MRKAFFAIVLGLGSSAAIAQQDPIARGLAIKNIGNIPPSSIFRYMTTTQIQDVVSRTCAIDQSSTISAALAAAKNSIKLPAGCWNIGSATLLPNGEKAGIVLSPDNIVNIEGEGNSTEIRATVPMTYMFWKAGVDVGGTKSQTFVHDLYFNANRNANICLRIGASKAGSWRNLYCRSFLTGAFLGGDESGTTNSLFYENDITGLWADGNISYANSTSTMPAYGLRLTSTATDNPIHKLVASYVYQAGVIAEGANNTLDAIHPYGNGITGPNYGIWAKSVTSITNIEADSVTVAGVKISGESVSVNGGIFYWPTAFTPATPSTFTGSVAIVDGGSVLSAGTVTGAPLTIGETVIGNGMIGQRITGQLTGTTGGAGTYTLDGNSQTVSLTAMQATSAVPVEIDNGIASASIISNMRTSLQTGPAVRWLGLSRPSNLNIHMSGYFLPQINDSSLNSISQNLLIMRKTGSASSVIIDAATTQTARTEFRSVNAPRYSIGTDGSAETGDTGSNLTIKARYNGSDNTIVQFTRGANALTIGASGTAIGFSGSTPVVKPTLPPAATDAASAITLTNALRSMVIANGLAQ